MENNKVMGMSVISDLGLDECIEYALSSGNKKLMSLINDNDDMIKSIMGKDLFGKLDHREKIVVGHLIQLHYLESKIINCDHLNVKNRN